MQSALDSIVAKYHQFAHVNATTSLLSQLDSIGVAQRLGLGVLQDEPTPEDVRSDDYLNTSTPHRVRASSPQATTSNTHPASSVWRQAASQWQQVSTNDLFSKLYRTLLGML